MAIIDLPALRGFEGARFELTLEVSESAFQGFYTGNRQRQSTLSDRLSGILVLPPSNDATLKAQREALLFGLRSSGDTLRMLTPHRKSTLGTISGTITAGANAAAGARSLTLAGALTRPNLLVSSGFEIDTNVDGLADGLTSYTTGTSTGLAYSGTAGNGSARAQIVAASSLGTSSADRIGWKFAADAAVTTGQAYTLACDVYGEPNAFVMLYVEWYTAGVALLGSPASAASVIPSTFQRRTLTATAPATAAFARVYIWCQERFNAPVNVALAVDNVQFEQAAAATAYAGLAALLAGSFIGTGGNLLQVAFAGATANDAGAMTVPLSMPLPKAVTSGAAVSLAPTGLWEWDSDAPQFNYSPGGLQDSVTIPLRQVIA